LRFKKQIKLQDSYIDLVKLLLPEILVDNFELISFQKDDKEEILHIYLKEMYSIPKEYRTEKISSKGFFPEITVQDFPIRGQRVYLHITRRRWLNEGTGKVVYRDWNLVAEGTRITDEFASFLKEIGRF
jgi:hypothetical protein